MSQSFFNEHPEKRNWKKNQSVLKSEFFFEISQKRRKTAPVAFDFMKPGVQCYDFRNIVALQIGEENGVFDSYNTAS
jgi:hypothetical protein